MSNPAADALWRAYCAATGYVGDYRGVDHFGDSAALKDELLALVMEGTKRATCCLTRDFANELMPAPGDHWIITDGQDVPRCIIRTTSIDVRPINTVTEEFAFIEGEGDKTLAWWKAAHDAYYTRQGAREGFTYSDAMDGICEQFDCVWPTPT